MLRYLFSNSFSSLLNLKLTGWTTLKPPLRYYVYIFNMYTYTVYNVVNIISIYTLVSNTICVCKRKIMISFLKDSYTFLLGNTIS